MFTNSSNSNSNSNSSLNGSADHSLLSPLKSVTTATAVAVVKTPLTKSAKKRMKEKERALRMKENPIENRELLDRRKRS